MLMKKSNRDIRDICFEEIPTRLPPLTCQAVANLLKTRPPDHDPDGDGPSSSGLSSLARTVPPTPGISNPAPPVPDPGYSGGKMAGRKTCRPIRHQVQQISQSSILMALLLSSHPWSLDKFRDFHPRPSPYTSFQQYYLDFISSQIDSPAGCAEQMRGKKRSLEQAMRLPHLVQDDMFADPLELDNVDNE